MEDTIEKAAEEYAHKSFVYPLNTFGEPLAIPPGQTVPMGYTKHCKVAKKHFVAGAEWQAERMLTKTQAIYFAGYLMGKKMQDPKADVSDIFDEWEKNLKPICKA